MVDPNDYFRRHLEQLVAAIRARDVDPALIVVDTQARATVGTDENDNSAMGKVMDGLSALSERYACPVVTVHHTGKDPTRGARGASAVKAALDFEVQVTEGRIDFTKQKDALSPDPWRFELKPSGESAWAAPTNPYRGAVVLAERIRKAFARARG